VQTGPNPPYWQPPPTQKRGPLFWIGIAILIIIVVIGVAFAAAFSIGVFQAVSTSSEPPNINITNTSGTYQASAGCILGSGSTEFTISATLVNTGASGYANIAYEVNGVQQATNTYYVGSQSQLPITQSFTVSTCYSTTPTYSVLLLSQRASLPIASIS
jgi:hypothetical protein